MAARSMTWNVRMLPPIKRHGGGASRVPGEVATRVIAEALKLYSEDVLRKARGVLTDTAAKIQADAVEAVPQEMTTGQLKQSIRVETPDQNTRDVVAAAPYAGFLEYGTRSGNPPYDKIVAWAKRKGFENPERAAYFIKRKIYSQGIPAQPFFFPAAERHRQSFINRMEEVFK